LAAVNKYRYSRAYFKILDLIMSNPEESVFVIRGGQGAGKTISILELIIQSLISSPKEATVLSSELSKMKRTVIRDYKKIAKDWGLLNSDSPFNKTESKHEYSVGSYIDFIGADVSDVGKGFRRDILYINEADKLELDTAVQFISRAKITIIDYNPDRLFWGDDYINENNFITLTFKDNEFLSESEVRSILEYKTRGFFNPQLPFGELFKEENIKNKYWANKWKVYGLGMVGSLDGTVYENWDVIHRIPDEAELIGYGLDWGFEGDPLAMVALYKYNKTLIVDEIIYKHKLTNDVLVSELRRLAVKTSVPIIADNSEPKSITDVSNAGFDCRKCSKREGHKEYAIKKMNSFETWYVTDRSVNVKLELSRYIYGKDRAGNSTGKPKDGNDHAMDALIYLVNEILNLGAKSDSPVVPPNKYHRPVVKLKGISTYL
jgi:phage terminase large subunit